MPKSNASVHSSQSKRGKTGKPTEVDESLFGKNGKTIVANTLGGTGSQRQTQLSEEAQKIARKVRDGDFSHPEIMVLPASEIERMKNEAIIISKEEELNQRKILEEQKEKQQAAAKARKQRM
jgi:hypothetical protein